MSLIQQSNLADVKDVSSPSPIRDLTQRLCSFNGRTMPQQDDVRSHRTMFTRILCSCYRSDGIDLRGDKNGVCACLHCGCVGAPLISCRSEKYIQTRPAEVRRIRSCHLIQPLPQALSLLGVTPYGTSREPKFTVTNTLIARAKAARAALSNIKWL